MHGLVLAVAGVWLAALLPGPMQAASRAATEVRELDRIIAVVNNDVITDTELTRRLDETKRQIAAEKPGALPADAVLRRQLLERLVLERIQLQLAAQAGIRVTEADVDQALQGIARRNAITPEQLQQQLRQSGIDPAGHREQLREQLVIQQLQEREVANRVSVTDAEISAFLENQEGRRRVNAEYQLSHILIGVPENATPETIQATRRRVEAIHAELRQGRDFAQTAISHSQAAEALNGGSLGWKKAGELPELFVAAVQDLRPGGVSEIVRSPGGFHILKLHEKRGDIPTQAVVQTHARHILLRPSPIQSAAEIRRKLLALRERVAQGEDFAALARANSEDPGSAASGGDLGWAGPGQFVPEFEKAMAALKPGELSEPVQSPFGFHLVQVLERREQDVSQERLRASARSQIHARKANERFEQWVRQLRDEAFVEYYLDDVN